MISSSSAFESLSPPKVKVPGEVRPIRRVQPVEVAGDEDLQRGAFLHVGGLFGKLRRALRQPLGGEGFESAFAFSDGRHGIVRQARKLVPKRTVEFASSFGFTHPTPLLEKERHARHRALVTDAANPFGFHRARTRTAFPTNDHPTDTVEIDRSEIFQQRFDGQETDGDWRVP